MTRKLKNIERSTADDQNVDAFRYHPVFKPRSVLSLLFDLARMPTGSDYVAKSRHRTETDGITKASPVAPIKTVFDLQRFARLKTDEDNSEE